MLHRTRTRAGESLLEAILEGDVLFFRSKESGGSGGGDGGGSSQEDDDSADDDDDDSQDEGGDGDGGNSDDDDDDQAEADARVRRANRQAAKLRVQLKEANERLAKLEAKSDKPDDDAEAEKVTKQMRDAEERAAKAEARLLAIERERVVTKVATDLGFADPDVVFALAQSGRIEDLDTDDDEPWDRRDVKLALKALKKAKPHLLKDTGNESSNNGGDGGRSTGTSPTRRTRSSEDLEKLPIGQRAHARLARAFSKQ